MRPVRRTVRVAFSRTRILGPDFKKLLRGLGQEERAVGPASRRIAGAGAHVVAMIVVRSGFSLQTRSAMARLHRQPGPTFGPVAQGLGDQGPSVQDQCRSAGRRPKSKNGTTYPQPEAEPPSSVTSTYPARVAAQRAACVSAKARLIQPITPSCEAPALTKAGSGMVSAPARRSLTPPSSTVASTSICPGLRSIGAVISNVPFFCGSALKVWPFNDTSMFAAVTGALSAARSR